MRNNWENKGKRLIVGPGTIAAAVRVSVDAAASPWGLMRKAAFTLVTRVVLGDEALGCFSSPA